MLFAAVDFADYIDCRGDRLVAPILSARVPICAEKTQMSVDGTADAADCINVALFLCVCEFPAALYSLGSKRDQPPNSLSREVAARNLRRKRFPVERRRANRR